MAELTLTTEAGDEHHFSDFPVIIGRSRRCQLKLDDGRISRQHAMIDYRAGTFHIEDMDSRHGTFVNDTRVIEPVELGDGDRIGLGPLILRVATGAQLQEQTDPDVPAAEIPDATPRRAPAPEPSPRLHPADATIFNAPPDMTSQVVQPRLRQGAIAYNPPEDMRVGISERVVVRIGRAVAETLLQGMKGGGPARLEDIRLSSVMSATLSGAAFEVTDLSEPDQMIPETGFAEWSWNVMPTRSGQQSLHLSVAMTFPFEGRERKLSHPVIDREIAVQVNVPYRIRTFITSYWQWMATAVLLPIAGWAATEFLPW